MLELLLIEEIELNELKELDETELEEIEDKLDLEDDDKDEEDIEEDEELFVDSALSAKRFNTSGGFKTNCSASKTLLVNESVSLINVISCCCIVPVT